MAGNESELLEHRMHEVVLQTLDREHNGVMLRASDYAKTLGKWKGKPVYFGNAHPSPSKLNRDREAELKRVGAKQVGVVDNPHIAPGADGRPELRGTLDITGSEGVEKLMGEGFAIRPSTALWLRPAGAEPDHVLIFNEGGDIQAGDRGAFIINQQELDDMADDDEKEPGWFAKFRAEFNRKPEPEPAPEPSNRDDEMAKFQAELEAVKAKAEAAEKEAKELKEHLEKAETTLAEVEQQRKDREWESFKALTPPGMLKDEAKAREAFEKDPGAVAIQAMTFLANRPDGNDAEGDMFVTPPEEPDPTAPYMTVFAPEPAATEGGD